MEFLEVPLSEFSAPGGWKARFTEAATRPVATTSGVLDAALYDVPSVPKVDPDETKRQVMALSGDNRPIVLSMTVGNQNYSGEALGTILEFLSIIRNFRAVVVVNEQKKLIAYFPGHQAKFLALRSLSQMRDEFTNLVKSGEISVSWNPELLADKVVNIGATYADALEQMNRGALSCIAVVDRSDRFRGIIDREHVTGSLLLALAGAPDHLAADRQTSERVGGTAPRHSKSF